MKQPAIYKVWRALAATACLSSRAFRTITKVIRFLLNARAKWAGFDERGGNRGTESLLLQSNAAVDKKSKASSNNNTLLLEIESGCDSMSARELVSNKNAPQNELCRDKTRVWQKGEKGPK